MENKQKSAWWSAMIKRLGSEEAVRAEMKRRQEKSRKNYSGNGGFKHMAETDPKKLSKLSSDAANKRHGNLNPVPHKLKISNSKDSE